jgi:hypothetical protein
VERDTKGLILNEAAAQDLAQVEEALKRAEAEEVTTSLRNVERKKQADLKKRVSDENRAGNQNN